MGEVGGEVSTVEMETWLEHEAHEFVREIVEVLSSEHATYALLPYEAFEGLPVQVLGRRCLSLPLTCPRFGSGCSYSCSSSD